MTFFSSAGLGTSTGAVLFERPQLRFELRHFFFGHFAQLFIFVGAHLAGGGQVVAHF
jgi:hypothetical protein